MNGQLFLGRTGNAAAVGSIQVPAPGGGTRRLIDLASLSVLAAAMDAADEESDHLWSQNLEWRVSAPVLSAWLDQAAVALAHATLATAALVEIEAVLIDGWMPVRVRAEIVRRTEAALLGLDLAGIDPPAIREGTVGAEARALGAAAIPLSQRYLIDQNAAVRAG
jgi:predicted NBD/HSP70 family sugar kinase